MDTMEFGAEETKAVGHPIICATHIGFRAAALFIYLFGSVRKKNCILHFFWTVTLIRSDYLNLTKFIFIFPSEFYKNKITTIKFFFEILILSNLLENLFTEFLHLWKVKTYSSCYQGCYFWRKNSASIVWNIVVCK